MVAEMGTEVLFAAMNDGILSLPLAPRPIAVLLLVQLKDVAVPEKETGVVGAPAHTIWLGG